MMKFMCIVTVLFLLPFSGWSGTFLETFDGRGLEAWQELTDCPPLIVIFCRSDFPIATLAEL